MADINGKTIAFLVAAEGIERVELTEPWAAVVEAGGSPVLLSPEKGDVQTFDHLDKAETLPVDKAVKDADLADYDALVLPGGVANPDALRLDGDAVGFIRDFVGTGKPVAAICHAPWTLVEAGVAAGTHADLVAEPAHRHHQRGRRPGSTSRSSRTATSSPAATPTTSPPSPRPCSTRSPADRTRGTIAG